MRNRNKLGDVINSGHIVHFHCLPGAPIFTWIAKVEQQWGVVAIWADLFQGGEEISKEKVITDYKSLKKSVEVDSLHFWPLQWLLYQSGNLSASMLLIIYFLLHTSWRTSQNWRSKSFVCKLKLFTDATLIGHSLISMEVPWTSHTCWFYLFWVTDTNAKESSQ